MRQSIPVCEVCEVFMGAKALAVSLTNLRSLEIIYIDL